MFNQFGKTIVLMGTVLGVKNVENSRACLCSEYKELILTMKFVSLGATTDCPVVPCYHVANVEVASACEEFRTSVGGNRERLCTWGGKIPASPKSRATVFDGCAYV